jgi:hypothetical protein
MIDKFWLGKLDVLINDGANWTVSDDISEIKTTTELILSEKRMELNCQLC